VRCIALLVLWLPGAVLGQTAAPASLVSNPFYESYQPEVAVSGNVIVGVMTAAAAHALVDDSLVLTTTASTADKGVCLTAASNDGIYSSRNQYLLPDAASGAVRLPYRSGLADVVQEYAGQIAVAAESGECNGGGSDYYVLSSINASSGDDIYIYLNSFGATDVFYQLGNGGDGIPVEACDYISEGRRTTFDFVCNLGKQPGGEWLDVTIIRERFGREQPPVQLRIAGPAP